MNRRNFITTIAAAFAAGPAALKAATEKSPFVWAPGKPKRFKRSDVIIEMEREAFRSMDQLMRNMRETSDRIALDVLRDKPGTITFRRPLPYDRQE